LGGSQKKIPKKGGKKKNGGFPTPKKKKKGENTPVKNVNKENINPCPLPWNN